MRSLHRSVSCKDSFYSGGRTVQSVSRGRAEREIDLGDAYLFAVPVNLVYELLNILWENERP